MTIRFFSSLFLMVSGSVILMPSSSESTLKQKIIEQIAPIQNIKKNDRDELIRFIEKNLRIVTKYREYGPVISDQTNPDIQRFLLKQTIEKALEAAKIRNVKADLSQGALKVWLFHVIKSWENQKDGLLNTWTEPFTKILFNMGVNIYADKAKDVIPQKLSDIFTGLMLKGSLDSNIGVTEDILKIAAKKNLKDWLDSTKGLGPLTTTHQKVVQENRVQLRGYVQKAYQDVMAAKGSKAEMLDLGSLDMIIHETTQKLDKEKDYKKQPSVTVLQKALNQHIKETYGLGNAPKPGKMS